uniref:Uncharacterized protein n=1 Tax=Panagrolaimus sp. ES5 TaxID=591445 RepID=A0AC34GS19_9BILA
MIGSSAGIGQATALLFAQEGAYVTIHGQSTEKLEATKTLLLQAGINEDKILIISGSIQEEETQKNLIEKTVQKFGKLDILINNVGQSRKPNVPDRLDIEHYDYVMNSPLTPYYSVAKCALDSYTKNAAVVYGSNGIRVNAINPGTVDTDIWKRSDDPRVTSFCDKLIKETIVDRMGKSEEIARVIALLASDDGAFITGSCWVIDGGAMVTPSYFGQT